MVKKKSNEATSVASQSRSRKSKKEILKPHKAGTTAQNEFIKFIANLLGDIEDVSISVDGSERIPIKEIKKRLN
jgi:hypothetical protein|tara:strand:- start:579 stop:800 length:222 start_codon:yes stop_codon:yes gene_type:complete